MKKLIILLAFVLYSSVCFAIVLGAEFIAIKDSGGKIIVIDKSQIFAIVSKDGLAIGLYSDVIRDRKGLLSEITVIEFKDRRAATTWVEENFEPKCITKGKPNKKCDPIDAPDLSE